IYVWCVRVCMVCPTPTCACESEPSTLLIAGKVYNRARGKYIVPTPSLVMIPCMPSFPRKCTVKRRFAEIIIDLVMCLTHPLFELSATCQPRRDTDHDFAEV